MSDATTQRDPVDLLAEEFSARLRAGEVPSIDEFVSRCPEQDASIRALFASIALVERVSSQEYHERGFERQTHRPAARPIKTLGDFRILREVGRGGMGVVYEALQTSLNRRVALKLLGPHVSGSATQLERFQREAKAAARLHHTNIIPIYGLGEDAGLHFYAMQFIDGSSLGDVIRSVRRLSRPRTSEDSLDALTAATEQLPATEPGSSAAPAGDPDAAARALLRGVGPRRRAPSGPAESVEPPARGDAAEPPATAPTVEITPPDDHHSPGLGDRYWRGVARIVAEVADALSYAHRHGVLHRDIKPSNLLLDRDGAIWVADFGLAKHEDQEGITGTGDVVGTLRYMAPEQFNGHSDVRSDIYSLGLTLFELLALRPAYEESRHGLLIQSKTREAPPRLRTINPRIPADLETITQKSCATEPDHRYQTAGEFAEDLARVLEGRPIRARRVTAPERLWRWCRRNPAVAGLCGATFLLLLTLAVVFAIGNHRTGRALAHLEREHARAETNLALALRAFDQIIGNISARGIVPTADLDADGLQLTAPESALTDADAALLETLLAFFDRFANENGTDLKAESASARKRVGDIQQRLGRFVEAEATYGAALEAYTALWEQAQDERADEWIQARVSILNEIGVTASRRGAFMLAMYQHIEARRLLERSPSLLASRAGRFELARTLLLLCSIGSRNGVDSLEESLRHGSPPGAGTELQPPPADANIFVKSRVWPRRDASRFPGERRGEWRRAIDRSVALLQELLAEEPGNPEFRLCLARSFREQVGIARLRRDRARAEQCLATAVDCLDQLVTDFPAHPSYQSALAEMLCTRLSLPGEPESDPGAVRRVERAVALSGELLTAYPQIPEYRFLNGSVLYRLASLQQALGRPEQARETYLRAITFQESLCRQFPSVLHNPVALAESLQKLAEVEVSLGRTEAAATHLNTAIAQLEKFPKRKAARFLPRLIGKLRDRRAAIAFDAASDPESQRPPE